ncbi:MAG: aminotransferase DegT [Bacteroidetes bacterium]|nr:MAG: aminotransferase DegT [Bacteroidota bacterium]
MDYSSIVAFVRELYATSEFIPLSVPRFVGREKEYLCDCIDSTFVSSVGEYVDRFELEVAEYTASPYAIACVNGTNALHIALELVGVQPGEEVITQPLTFVATCNAIAYAGAVPVFVDVDMQTMGLSPDALRAWLQDNAAMRGGECYNRHSGRRIRACIPMHTFGHPVRLDELVPICQEWGLELVEDAAESLGSLYRGHHTGTFGRIGILSFNGNKTITTGGGGMLLMRDEEFAHRAKHLTTQAKIPHPWEFCHDGVGYNYRMPNINAALGCAQLEQLETFLNDKRQLATEYAAFFATLDGMDYFQEPENAQSNYWLHAVLLRDRKERDAFLEYTNSQGIMTRPIWELMPRLPMFTNSQRGPLPHAEELADRVVNLPSSPRLNDGGGYE